MTFESYLEGGRAPLYHFVLNDFNLYSILNDDTLKTGTRGRDVNLKSIDDEGYMPSISVTRNSKYSDRGNLRIELDYNKLLKDGYRSIPIDEMGNAITRKRHSFFKQYKKPMNPFYGYKKVHYGGKINKKEGGKDIFLEEEYEERIYKNISNLGKYIISIKLTKYFMIADTHIKSDKYIIFKNYIEKYPHIKILDKYENIIMDINTIREREKEKSTI